MVADTADIECDIALFEHLNGGYLTSDRCGDMERCEELAAASLPHVRLPDERQFMETMSRPRPFNGIERQGRNSDDRQR
jgi:hypothetical protein